MIPFILYETTLWNFLSVFDPLLEGYLSIIFSLLLWFMLTYPFFRFLKNGLLDTFYIIFTTILIGSVLAFFGFPSVIVGLIMVIFYILIMRHVAKMNDRATIELTIKLGVFLSVFSLLEGIVRTILMLILIMWFFLESEKNRPKKDKKEE